MNLEQVREESELIAANLGYEVLPLLPLLDDELRLRDREIVVARTLALGAVVACSYGFEHRQAYRWLKHERLLQSLTLEEQKFLSNPYKPNPFAYQVEGLWALAWSLKIVEELDFGKACAGNFVSLMPDLETQESSADFQGRAYLRTHEEIVAKCDLAYRLHWAVRQSELDGKSTPGKVAPYVITERRRAFEWLLSDENWDDISLDT